MNKESILFLTKDAFCKAYLPCYGNRYYAGKTPNLDELVDKGTLYTNFFTAAPSSAMSYLSMFTRKYPYQQEMQIYTQLPEDFKGRTLFDDAYEMGFSCHVLWDAGWIHLAYDYTRCYGKNTTLHNMENFRQPVGSHYKHEGVLVRNQEKEEEGVTRLRNELNTIFENNNKVFLWCHLPHVLKGRTSYGDDIDLFDRYLGVFREFFSDDNIFISADHGNMNGLKGKVCYGFDVYDTSISIPFISPRINELKICDTHICNINVFELLFKRKVVESSIIFSDSQYYAQPKRKLAVIFEKYRYIYNKADNSEELYDIEYDPNQNFNLISDDIYDVDRKLVSPAREYYFYPEWDKLPEIRTKLRAEKDKIWRDINKRQKVLMNVTGLLKKNKLIHGLLKGLKNRYIASKSK